MADPTQKNSSNEAAVAKPSYWLLVERLENWNIDQQDGFTQFGLPEMKKKLADKIRAGDLLIFYVSSGISSFADIRAADEDGVSKLRLGGSYDTLFPWRVKTSPVLTLPRDRWVPIKDLLSRLTFTKGKTDWRQLMRNSLRQLSDADANLLIRAMHEAAQGTVKTT